MPISTAVFRFNSVVEQSQAEIDQSILSLLGAEAYASYQNYQQTTVQRSTADQIGSRLSYGNSPLSETQYSQLVSTLSTGQTVGGMPGRGGPEGGGGASTLITDAIVSEASSYLNNTQLEALKDVQALQQAEREAERAAFEAMQAARQNSRGQRPTD